jgi:dTDP-4-amino-4,6-dideoxygalactose transaminase
MMTIFGPGGVAITDDRQLAEDISSLRDQGRTRAEDISFVRRRDARWYDQKWVGYNMHMTEVCAGLGRVQLEMLPRFVSRRRENAAYLTRRLTDAGVPVALPPARPWSNPCYLHYVIFTSWRDALREHLRARGIETSIHYPAPLHVMEPIMTQFGTRPGQFPIAERVCRENLSLPVGPHMTPAMMDRLAGDVIAFFEGAA